MSKKAVVMFTVGALGAAALAEVIGSIEGDRFDPNGYTILPMALLFTIGWFILLGWLGIIRSGDTDLPQSTASR